VLRDDSLALGKRSARAPEPLLLDAGEFGFQGALNTSQIVALPQLR
jgi:hypothetical protein